MAGLGPAKCQLAKPGLHPGDGFETRMREGTATSSRIDSS
jgi:hypothetical protein